MKAQWVCLLLLLGVAAVSSHRLDILSRRVTPIIGAVVQPGSTTNKRENHQEHNIAVNVNNKNHVAINQGASGSGVSINGKGVAFLEVEKSDAADTGAVQPGSTINKRENHQEHNIAVNVNNKNHVAINQGTSGSGVSINGKGVALLEVDPSALSANAVRPGGTTNSKTNSQQNDISVNVNNNNNVGINQGADGAGVTINHKKAAFLEVESLNVGGSVTNTKANSQHNDIAVNVNNNNNVHINQGASGAGVQINGKKAA